MTITRIQTHSKSKTQTKRRIMLRPLTRLIPSGKTTMPAPDMSGTSEALLFGINYINTPYSLTGCLNDAMSIKTFLRQNVRLPLNKATLYTDVPGMGSSRPTFQTMFTALRNFSRSPSKNLYLYYSGHGSTINDPQEGKDSCLISCDLYAFSDDYLMGGLVQQLSANKNFIMIADCCNDGCLLDLPWSYNSTNGISQTPVGPNDGNVNANVVVLCSCRIDQYSYETAGRGAMTSTLTSIMRPGMTWRQLCDQLTAALAAQGYAMNPVINMSNPALLDSKCFA